MLTIKDLIKQAEEAAAALKVTKQKVWDESCKEVCNAKGKNLNSKKKRVPEGLSFDKKKAFSNPDKFVFNLIDHDQVLPPRPAKEPDHLPKDDSAILIIYPEGKAKPDKKPDIIEGEIIIKKYTLTLSLEIENGTKVHYVTKRDNLVGTFLNCEDLMVNRDYTKKGMVKSR